MKKRINSSEIERARKFSHVLFLCFFLLFILLFVGFGAMYAMGIDVLDYFKVPKQKVEESGKKIKKEILLDSTPEIIEIDIHDRNIQKLYHIVKITDSNTCWEDGYQEHDHIDVKKLSTKCKFSIASNLYKDQVEKTLDGKLYVKEEDVRSAYEELFGNGTYERQDSIPCFYKTNFLFRDDYYFTESVNPEEGSSMTSYEKLLKAYRKDNNLDIISGVVYHERVLHLLCKDSRCEHVIEPLQADAEYNEAYLSLYIDHNKDHLYQYTYHFKMDEAGFYRYMGYDRTNE